MQLHQACTITSSITEVASMGTHVQAAASDGSSQQVAAHAKNTIDGQLNFPDPQHGPKPQVLVQQFQQKVDVSILESDQCTGTGVLQP